MLSTRIIRTCVFIFACSLYPFSAPAFDQPSVTNHELELGQIDFQNSKQVNDFVGYMVDRHGFSRGELTQIFKQVQFSDQSIQLIKPGPITKPKNWSVYCARFIEPIRVKAGVNFWNTYSTALARAEQQYGIPAQIIV